MAKTLLKMTYDAPEMILFSVAAERIVCTSYYGEAEGEDLDKELGTW